MTETIQSANEAKKPPPWWPVFAAIERERFTQIVAFPPARQDGTGRLYEAWASEFNRQLTARHEAGKPGVWAKSVLAQLFCALSEEDEIGLEGELIYTASLIVAWVEDLRERRDAKA